MDAIIDGIGGKRTVIIYPTNAMRRFAKNEYNSLMVTVCNKLRIPLLNEDIVEFLSTNMKSNVRSIPGDMKVVYDLD